MLLLSFWWYLVVNSSIYLLNKPILNSSIEANEEKSNLYEVLDNNGDAIGGNEDAFDDSEDGDDAEAGSSNNPTEGIHCELCSTTTQSKQSMRRHCLQSHDLVSAPPLIRQSGIAVYSSPFCLLTSGLLFQDMGLWAIWLNQNFRFSGNQAKNWLNWCKLLISMQLLYWQRHRCIKEKLLHPPSKIKSNLARPFYPRNTRPLSGTNSLSKREEVNWKFDSSFQPSGYFRKDICHSCNHCDAMFW